MEIQQFYQRIKNNYKVKVNSRLSSAPATNYCQMLQEVSEVQRFEVSYLDIAEVSSKGITTCNMLRSQLQNNHYMKQRYYYTTIVSQHVAQEPLHIAKVSLQRKSVTTLCTSQRYY